MKRSYKSHKQQIRNEACYLMWYERLHDICLTFVKWDGFPFVESMLNEVMQYLNELLYKGYAVGYTYITDELGGTIPIIGKVTPSAGNTWYNGHYHYELETETTTFHTNRDAMAICRPTPAGRSLMVLCEKYADILTKIELATELNVKGQNTPVIIQSPPGQELTYANMFEEIAGYKPVVYGREGILGKDSESMLAYRFLQPAVYVADKLEMLKHDILNDFYNELGISSKTIEKKAQLISDELNIDHTSNDLSKNIFMDVRTEFCNEINRMFGLNVTCSFNAQDMVIGPRGLFDV